MAHRRRPAPGWNPAPIGHAGAGYGIRGGGDRGRRRARGPGGRRARGPGQRRFLGEEGVAAAIATTMAPFGAYAVEAEEGSVGATTISLEALHDYRTSV